MAERTFTGHCERASHAACDGIMRAATGWNWWCTCHCHPEPVISDPAHRPALDFYHRHKAGA